jgi:HSP20 family protein
MTSPTERPSRPLARWDPFREFEDLYTQMGRLWESAFGSGGPAAAAGWAPIADLCETEDAYVAEIEVPGVKREDLAVDLTGNELTVTGEVKEAGHEGVVRRRARRSGRFEYRTTLPRDVDAEQVSAALADGVLTVRVPKVEAAKPRKIEIQG